MTKVRLFEAFAGYGGCSHALELAKIPYECVGYSEIDKYAVQCYNQNFSNRKNYGDMRKINPKSLPDFNLFSAGFPCQSFSIAGKRKGFADIRGTLFFEIIRIAEVKKPKYMILENVKGLVNHDNGRTFAVIRQSLRDIGYDMIYKVLNSKDYGVPQNREKIWIICKLGKWDFMEFQFPYKEPLKLSIKDVLEDEADEKYYLSEKCVNTIFSRHRKKEDGVSPTITKSNYKLNENTPLTIEKKINKIQYDISGKGYASQQDRLYFTDGIMCSLPNANPVNKINILTGLQKHQSMKKNGISNSLPSAMGEGHTPMIMSRLIEKTRDVSLALEIAQEISSKEDKPIQVDIYHLQHGEIRPLSTYIPQNLDEHRCLQAGEPKEVLVYKNRVRRLTPKECFRLMGFLQDQIDITGLSDTQAYKLAGNGWEIQTVSKILSELLRPKCRGILTQ